MESVICFAAHPDDMEFSCTGTLKKYFTDMYDVYYIIVTNGENGFKTAHLSRDERIRTRKAEQREVGKRLGLKDIIFLDYRDGFLEYTEDLRRDLVMHIKEIRPDIVFSFDPANRAFDDINLYHRDHRIVAEAVFDACFAAKNAWMYPGPPHPVKKIYFYGSNDPNYYVDIHDVMDFKLDLLSCHRSQFPDFKKIEKLIKEKISPPTGDYPHAESFRVVEIEQLV
jgi:LmbE family N-acetylglucosaminyl deacetylase